MTLCKKGARLSSLRLKEGKKEAMLPFGSGGGAAASPGGR
jgi:hypothetical protein